MTWQHHRTQHARNCDQCPPRHPAAWNLIQRGVPPMYLCLTHALRVAAAYGIEPPTTQAPAARHE